MGARVSSGKKQDTREKLPGGERFLLLPLSLDLMSYFSVSKMSFKTRSLIELLVTYGEADGRKEENKSEMKEREKERKQKREVGEKE